MKNQLTPNGFQYGILDSYYGFKTEFAFIIK